MSTALRSSGRTAGTIALLALVVLPVFFSAAHAQQGQIGIYSDVSRSSCSLSDASPGQILAYVMVNTSTGLTGVRFTASKPGCFNATWVEDQVPAEYAFIGDSQTDISIATGSCQPGLVHVLTMVFQKTSTTAPCCQFDIAAPAGFATPIYTDCSFTELPLPVNAAYVNANATCPCSNPFNLAPSQAFNPHPGQGTISNLAIGLTLTWEATDAENDPLSFDIYLGTTADPPLVGQGLTQPQFASAALSFDTVYYWKVVVKDNAGHATDGQVWSFRTAVEGGVPATPVNPFPTEGATNVLHSLTLSWMISGGNGPALQYEIHFGTTSTPPVVATIPAALNPKYPISGLALDTTYYWYVVTIGQGKNAQGALWSFHTSASNPPPNAPSLPYPQNNALTVSANVTLGWTAADPEGEPLEYDVYFGTDPNPPLLAHTTEAQLTPGNLSNITKYYWRVVAFDPLNQSASSEVWNFTTGGAPTVPVLISPTLAAIVSPRMVTFHWSSTADANAYPMKFDVYMGTSTPPPQVVTGLTNTYYYPPGDLQQNAAYYWKVVAFDSHGGSTDGPIWNFNTRALIPPLPPSSPNPADGATNVSVTPTLTWECSDPDNQELFYNLYFGTNPGLLTLYPLHVKSFTPPYTLVSGTTYYWTVTAWDSDNSSAQGPQWVFTTRTDGVNQPPTTPAVVSPSNGATSQPTSLQLEWTSSDPEGYPLHYDVYVGTTPTPLLVAAGITSTTYGLTSLSASTQYYWRIVAKDAQGVYTTGPLWNFTTNGPSNKKLAIGLYADASGTSCSLSDKGAGMRNVYVVLNGPSLYTGVRFVAKKPDCFNATWMYDSTPYVTVGNSQTDVSIGFGTCASGPLTVMTITYLSAGNTQGCCDYQVDAPAIIGKMLVTDCTFQELVPLSQPLLGISSNDACPACDAGGYLAVAETEDTCRAAAGPHQFTVDLRLSTGVATDFGSVKVVVGTGLTFVSCERGEMIQDWPTFNYQENQGAVTISASGTAIPAGNTGVFARLTFTANCCDWAAPAELGLTNATGDFAACRLIGTHLQCRYPADGDVNGDGNITVADAQCALETYLYAPLAPPSDCGGPGAAYRADVDCSGLPTPADAHCIFRNWLDQSCSFCNGSAMVAATPGPAPQLALRTVREADDIVVILSARSAGDMAALGLELTYPDGIEPLRADAPSKDVFAALQTRVVAPGRVRVGAYANADHSLPRSGDLLAVRFRVKSDELHGTVTALEFVDGLAGAPNVSVSLENTAPARSVNQIVLHQNTPNPFNPLTMIRFELPEPMHVRLSIFDVHGRLVKQLLDERREAGTSTVEWDGTDSHARTVATGVYFYVLDTGGSRLQHKMVLLK